MEIDTRNGFTLIRLTAAMAVIFTHSFQHVGIAKDYLEGTGAYPLSKFGVDAFFVISGYLLTQSLLRNSSLPNYFVRRAVRLIPGLAIAVLFTIAIGMIFHTGKHYFPEANQYFWNITMFWPSPYIGGLFEGNHTNVVNGSLWTLPIEVTCYIALAGVSFCKALNARFAAVLCVILTYILFFAPLNWQMTFGGMTTVFVINLMILFFAGSFLASLGNRLPVSPWATAIAVLMIVYGVATQEDVWQRSVFFHLVFFPYVVIACSRHFRRAAFLNKWDISYGLYIYAGVVQQCLEATLNGWVKSPILFFIISVALTVPIALLSWRYVEQPAMRLKNIPAKLSELSMARLKPLSRIEASQ